MLNVRTFSLLPVVDNSYRAPAPAPTSCTPPARTHISPPFSPGSLEYLKISNQGEEEEIQREKEKNEIKRDRKRKRLLASLQSALVSHIYPLQVHWID